MEDSILKMQALRKLGGDWLVPHVAGEPWLEDPPLYPWVALGFAKSKGEARRLIAGGGARVGADKVTDMVSIGLHRRTPWLLELRLDALPL